MHSSMDKQLCWVRRARQIALALGCWFTFAIVSGAAAVITNATAVNVTPASFSVFWRAPSSSAPSIEVFADASGTTSLAGKVGIEAFPLQTGNPQAAAGYERRLSQAALRSKTQGYSLMMMRVTGCSPSTTYYFRVKSLLPSGGSEQFPAGRSLLAVTTPGENSFVVNYQQLIIDVADLNTEGRVCLLSHTNAAYPLAAIVGDGVGPSQVFFDVNNLFDEAGGGNFAGLGAQEFSVDVLGPNGTDLSQNFIVNFSASFAVAQATLASLGSEFFAASIGSTIVLFGENGAVTIEGNSGIGLSTINLTLEIPPGHLTNLTLTGLAPELNPLGSSVTHQGGSTWLVQLAAQAGQSFSGNKAMAQLAFVAGTNRTSAFVPLKVVGVTAIKPSATAVGQVVSDSGRVVVVGDEPLVEAERSSNGSRRLTLYGRPSYAYAVEYAEAIAGGDWNLWKRVPMTALSTTFQAPEAAGPNVFYRAYEFQADPPLLEANLAPGGARSLLLYGKRGASYSLEYKGDLASRGVWQPLGTIALTNSFSSLAAPTNGANVFYRAAQ